MRLILLIFALLALSVVPVRADVSIVVGAGNGSGFTITARLLAKHLPWHLLHQQDVVVKTMPGAGGVKAATWLYQQAPKDGSVIGTFQPNVLMLAYLRHEDFNPLGFAWIGTISSYGHDAYALFVRGSSPFRSVSDLRGSRAAAIGGNGAGSESVTAVRLLKSFLGLNLKLVTGYSNGQEMFLAADRGEIDGRMVSYTTVEAQRPDWLSGGGRPLLVYSGSKRFSVWPDVPTASELANTPQAKAVLTFMQAPFKLWRPYAGPPGTDAEALADLRRAFIATMRDPNFLDDAARIGADVSPKGAHGVLTFIRGMAETPPAVLDRIRSTLFQPS